MSRLIYRQLFLKTVKLHRELKVTVLAVNKFACADWYSMNSQNDIFKTDKSCEIFNASAAIDDQLTVHKETQ